MKMTLLLGIALLVLGAVLILLGFNATQAPLEEIGQTLTGRYSNRTVMYLVSGAVAGVVGLVLIVRGK